MFVPNTAAVARGVAHAADVRQSAFRCDRLIRANMQIFLSKMTDTITIVFS